MNKKQREDLLRQHAEITKRNDLRRKLLDIDIEDLIKKYERICRAFVGAYERLERNDLIRDGEKEVYEEIKLMYARRDLLNAIENKKIHNDKTK